ncbi:MAG: MFS transporter [Ardenticatenaceae bacterium]|nr:MFS transporter [Ardenticatenaceae bacterium]
MTALSRVWTKRPLPTEHRANFIHLYLDIAWYGVLSGSAIAFMAIFAARQGANGFQLGLLNAAPAVVNLAVTLPAGQWLQSRPISRAVFWMSFWHRLVYLPLIFVPMIGSAHFQIWALLGLVLLMSLPGTVLAVGFNAVFASAVPPEWRSHVTGRRNVLLAVCYMASSLVSGQLLDWLAFPLGYQVVFGIGLVGAMMSSLHLWFVRPLQTGGYQNGKSLGDNARPGMVRTVGDGTWAGIGLRFFTRFRQRPLLRSRVLSGPFGPIVGLLFLFHFAQYLAIPIFPLYWVNYLHLTDAEISLGNAVFYATVLLGSTQLTRVTNRFQHKGVLLWGMVTMSLYPALTAVTQNLTLFLITSAVGGLSWSLAGGAIANYMLERIPEEERPSHLAWYNLALNAAVLLGSMLGPLFAQQVGLAMALGIAAVCRLGAALAVRRWG